MGEKTFIKVDGQQVFTANAVFEMLQAQSRRIDRAKHMAMLSLVLGVLSFVGLIFAIAR